MSTRDVNADRSGPKNLMDLATKAQAYKALLDASEHHAANYNSESQEGVDDAFEHFANLHRDPETGSINMAELNATKNLLDAHLAKGKGV
jgi:hypothetical protein